MDPFVMSEDTRFWFRLIPQLFGMVIVIILAFAQIADFLIKGNARHILGCMIFLCLLPIFFFRVMAATDPPRLPIDVITDGVLIAYAATMFLTLIWGVWLLIEKHKIGSARRRIKQSNQQKEAEYVKPE